MAAHPKKKESNNNFTFTRNPSKCASPTLLSEQETAYPTKENDQDREVIPLKIP